MVVDIRENAEGSYSEQRKQFLSSAEAERMYREPVVNRDTGEPVFITKATLTHTFSNWGTDQISAAKHIQEIIENAVLTHAEPITHGNESATGIYTLFGAVQTEKGVQPVKIKVKEYNLSNQRIPANIQTYFDLHGMRNPYASAYDGRVLELESIEKEEASSSALPTLDTYKVSQGEYPSASSIIRVAELYDLVNSEYCKYLPEKTGRNGNPSGQNSMGLSFGELRDEVNGAPGREGAAGRHTGTLVKSAHSAGIRTEGYGLPTSFTETGKQAQGLPLPQDGTFGRNTVGAAQAAGLPVQTAPAEYDDFMRTMTRLRDELAGDLQTARSVLPTPGSEGRIRELQNGLEGVNRQLAAMEKNRAQFTAAQEIARALGARLEIADLGEANGKYENGTITINPYTENPVRQVLVHELTHYIETSGQYDALSSRVLDFIAQDMQTDGNAMLEAVTRDYAARGVTLTQDGARRELVAKFCEEKLFTDEKSIKRLAQTDQTLFQRIRQWISDTIQKLRGAGQENALREMERLYEKAARSVGQKEGYQGAQYSIETDANGDKFVDVTENILNGKTEKDHAQILRDIIRNKFGNVIQANGQIFAVNSKTSSEWRRSKSASSLYQKNNSAYLDKIRVFNNADELMSASHDYVGEGLKHPRKDRFVEFARGKVNYRVGNNGYSADIVVGIGADGRADLYDIVNIRDKKITEARILPVTEELTSSPIGGASINISIPQTGQNGNTSGQNSMGLSFGELRDEVNGAPASFTETGKQAQGLPLPQDGTFGRNTVGAAQAGTYDSFIQPMIQLQNKLESDLKNARSVLPSEKNAERIQELESSLREVRAGVQRMEKNRAQFNEAQRIAEALGAKFQVADLGEANGKYENGTITINPYTENPVRQVLVHELTHYIETSGEYGALSGRVLDFIAQDMQTDGNAMLDELTRDYAARGVTLTQDGARRELVAKFCEEKLFTDEKSIKRLAQTDQTLFQRIRQWISDAIQKLRGAGQENALREMERLYEKAARSVGQKEGYQGAQYSIETDANGDKFVDVTEDILGDANERNISKILSKIIQEKFHNLIVANGQKIGINAKTNGEWRMSKEAQTLRAVQPEVYRDKLQSFNNADELLTVSRDYIGEKAKHKNYSEFARGKVRFRVGENGYVADVIVGITKNGKAYLYDLVNISQKEITDALYTSSGQSPADRNNASAITNSIPQTGQNGNTSGQNSMGLSFGELRDEVNGAPASFTETGKQAQGLPLPQDGTFGRDTVGAAQAGTYDSFIQPMIQLQNKLESDLKNARSVLPTPGSEGRIRELQNGLEGVNRQLAAMEKNRAQFTAAQEIARALGARLEIADLGEANGKYENGTITINPYTENPVRQVLVHELTHYIETSGQYDALSSRVLDFIAQDMHTDVKAMQNEITRDYAQYGVKLDENGARRELVAKFCEEKLFTDEKSIKRLAQTDAGLFQRIRQWISDTLRKLRGAGQENALREMERLYEKAARSVGQKEGYQGAQYSIETDANGDKFVDVTENILNGKTEKDHAQILRDIIRNKFGNIIQANGQTFIVNGKTNNEWRRARNADKLYKSDREAFLDKIRVFNNADELMSASHDYVGEGLKHPRKDRFVEFARGKVSYRVDENGYTADVVVGIGADGRADLYDIVNIQHKKITEAPLNNGQQRPKPPRR